jgi:hypothetical protein
VGAQLSAIVISQSLSRWTKAVAAGATALTCAPVWKSTKLADSEVPGHARKKENAAAIASELGGATKNDDRS